MPESLWRRIAAVFMARSMARAAQFGVFVLLGRMLGPEDLGLYAVISTTLILAVQIGSLGLRQASAVQLGQGQQAPGPLMSTLLILCPVLAVVSGGVVLAVTGALAPDLSEGLLLVCVLLAMLGAMAITLMQGIFLGQGRTGLFGLTDSLMPLLLLGAVGALLLTGQHSLSLVLAALAGAYALAGAAAVMLVRQDTPATAPDLARLPGMVRQGLAFALNVFLILLATRLSLYLVEHLMSAEAAGQFFVGQRLGDAVGEVALAAGFVLFSDAVRARDSQAAMRANAQVAAMALWGFAALSVIVALLAAPLIALLFGPAYEAAAGVLQIAALAIGPAAATKLIYPTLAGQGRPLWGTPAILAAIAVNAALSFVLIPAHGLAGAALALVVSQYVLLFGYCLVLKHRFEVGFRDSLIPPLNSIKKLI